VVPAKLPPLTLLPSFFFHPRALLRSRSPIDDDDEDEDEDDWECAERLVDLAFDQFACGDRKVTSLRDEVAWHPIPFASLAAFCSILFVFSLFATFC
jgi:hypothetical protein